jgi:hypothetical protein
LWLNMSVFKFANQYGLSTKDNHKANKTLEILELNTRDYLVAGREAKAIEFFNIMERLRKIIIAKSIKEIKESQIPYSNLIEIDSNLSLDDNKNNILKSVEQFIKKQKYPSVWYAIKTISSMSPRWKHIFDTIPQALNW